MDADTFANIAARSIAFVVIWGAFAFIIRAVIKTINSLFSSKK